MLKVDEYKAIIEEAIAAYELNHEPKNLYEPIAYTLENPGKRIRPVLTLMACHLFTDDFKQALAPAMGIEVFHNFTLLHDDLMDDAPTRRGNPTVYKKWNPNIAILSGDAMLVEAYKFIGQTKADKLSEVMQEFSQTALEVCEGQQYDMDFETRLDVSEDAYINMIRLKTSVLLASSLKIGALVGGAANNQADLLYQFGLNLGIAFQLMDDWLDAYSDPKVFGKKVGGDIVVNKKTFLLIKALEHAKNGEKESLLHWIEKDSFDEEEKINAVKGIYTQLNIDKLTLEKAHSYSEKAFEYLAKVDLPQHKKDSLLLIGKSLLNRIK